MQINGSDPPLTTVLPAHPTPLLPFFDPVIELARDKHRHLGEPERQPIRCRPTNPQMRT
jgi:hypothetical protein